MELNTRVRSEYNSGTVVAVSPDGTVSVQWDGFAGPTVALDPATLTIEGEPTPPAPRGWDRVETDTDDDIDYDEEHERHRNNMRDDGFEGDEGDDEGDDEPSDDDGMTDAEADADTLRMAGMGTDEDYGHMIGGDSDLMGEW